MGYAETVARALGHGKEVRNGSGFLTFCCCHDNDKTPALSVTDNDKGDVDVYCHAGCNWKDIKDTLRTMGHLPEWKPEHKATDHTKGHKAAPSLLPQSSPPEHDQPLEPEKDSYIWKQASKTGLEHAKKYLSSRAITIDPLPVCLKWNSYKEKKTGETNNMIVAAASMPDDKKVFAVQRLFIDLESYKKTGIKEKMYGPCKGRGVWFDRKGDKREIVIGEGIETTLSVIQATGKNGVAALSALGMKALIIPDETDTIYILVDSDQVNEKAATSMTGQRAAYALAQRFEESRPGRVAWLVSPDDSCFSSEPKYLDFNDLLKEDPTGTSIRARMEKAVKLTDISWRPPEEEIKEPATPQPWFPDALGRGSVSRFIDHDPPVLDWIFQGTLLAKTTGMLVGPGAAGKSTLSLLMLIASATGRDILPGIFTPTQAGKVLGVFAEDDETIIHHRMYTIVNRLFEHDPEARELLRVNMKVVTTVGHDVRFMSQANSELSESDFFQEVLRSIRGIEDLRLVILDPVSRYHGLEENDNGAGTFLVSLMERIAQQTGAAVIILHHVGKRAGSDVHGFDLDAAMHQDASRGASGLTNGVRWQCNLFGLPEKNAKKIMGVSTSEPGQYLALKVCKKNYGAPEPVHFLERLRGGTLRPCEPRTREIDADLELTVKGLVLDFVLSMEGRQLTERMLMDGKCGEWKSENSAITRSAVKQAIAKCLLDGELFERAGQNGSGRKITYLSRYPEPDAELEPEAIPENRREPEIEPEVFEPEYRREPEKNEFPVYKSPKCREKVEPEKMNRKNDAFRFVSPRNCGTVEPEILSPFGEGKPSSGLDREGYPPHPEEVTNAEFF